MAIKYYWRARRRLDEALGREYPTIVFLHIPKNAGSSLSYHFKSNIGRNSSPKVTFFYAWEEQEQIAAKLAAIKSGSYISGHFGWHHIKDILPNVFSITSLRDPVDRTISFYQYLRDLDEKDINPFFPCCNAKQMSFQEFCVQEDDVTRRAIINPQVRTLYSDAICGSPDTDFANPQLLETAIEHLKTFSFVTLTEKLNDDLPLISHLTKTKMKSRGPRRNVAKPGENQISREEARQILGDRVALDQKLYEAAKDIRNEKIATYLKK